MLSSMSKRKYRWNFRDDLELCKEVIARRPSSITAWEDLSAALTTNIGRGFTITRRGVRERLECLLKKNVAGEREKLKRDGTDEAATYLSSLLDEIASYEQDVTAALCISDETRKRKMVDCQPIISDIGVLTPASGQDGLTSGGDSIKSDRNKLQKANSFFSAKNRPSNTLWRTDYKLKKLDLLERKRLDSMEQYKMEVELRQKELELRQQELENERRRLELQEQNTALLQTLVVKLVEKFVPS